MPRVSLFPTLLRETLGPRTFPREPEPDLVMDDPHQVAAYSEAGRIDGVMSAAYLFHTGRISKTIAGCNKVADLGCGPATQLAQVAQLNPEIRFVGIDLSAEMLADAESHCSSLGLQNVEFREGDITSLSFCKSDEFDGLTSTMALHHLPTHEHLRKCFAEIRRVLKPGGALYLTDFSRLKSLRSVLFFAYMNRKNQPHLFSLDYERSLRAAFLQSDFQALAKELFGSAVESYATYGIPILQLLKTPDRELDSSKIGQLRAMREALPRRYRKELDDIRFFFWLDGLRGDPFRG